jgi:hypothetical protein
VAETKKKFTEAYPRPIPAIYNTVIQELLVQQHFIRYGINYKYNAVRGACTCLGCRRGATRVWSAAGHCRCGDWRDAWQCTVLGLTGCCCLHRRRCMRSAL